MTVLELKSQIIQEIGNEQDTAILKKLRTYYRKLKKVEAEKPCQYTLEELNRQLDIAEDDIRNGRVISHEQLLKEIEEW